MSNYNLLLNKVAIVTGCNRGIGKAILEAFLQNGAVVYAVARKEGCFQEMSPSSRLIPCYMDVKDKEAIKNLFLKIKKESGRLDVLVNNAGVMQDALLGMITNAQTHETFDVNVFANISMMQYASKLMIRQKSGSIINLASIMGVYGNAGQIVYAASKGAVIAMTKSAAKELGPNNIRVNAIAPGIIGTDMLYSVSEEKLNCLKKKVAMGTIGFPSEVAKAALFLASDLSNYISGQVLGVDGMMSN
ncbi:MAG: SDR family oxidoreductase [Clostridia bacterium]|nr:SDR family oxidoreductase [Clostridia bacterium]